MRRTLVILRHALTLLMAVATLSSAPPAAAQSSAPAVVGNWSGAISVQGQELPVIFHIKQEGDALAATMDSPQQGATDIPVDEVRAPGDSLLMNMPAINGAYQGIQTGEDRIEGTWTQNGQSFDLNLERQEEAGGTGASASPPRPQEPEPPYPYTTEDVTFENEQAGITLAGTLSLPEGEGPHPAVVLISGSGPQDRNSEVLNHKLFLVVADYLTRNGIAVLRYDERGVGESSGTFGTATSEDFATDASAAVHFLTGRAGIKEGGIGLLGMSEGGIVAPIVANQRDDVAFLVLMAPPAVPGSELLKEQSRLIDKAGGEPDSLIQQSQQTYDQLFEVVSNSTDSAQAASRAQQVLEERGQPKQAAQQQVRQLMSPWFQFFLTYDPAPALRQLDEPVLALYGERDLQVPPAQNQAVLEEALQAAPTSTFTVETVEGVNHLFQPAETGSPSEYSQIETTMAPKVLTRVTQWIKEHTDV